MRIGVLGAGSVGCYFTARFALNTEHDIFLLARSSYDAIREQGIRVTDRETDTLVSTRRFTVVNDIHAMPRCDVVIITVRTSQNESLFEYLPHLFTADAKLMSFQNGLDFEADIAKAAGDTTFYSGTSWIKISEIELGHVLHEYGRRLKLGRYVPNKAVVPIVDEDTGLPLLFEPAGFECQFIENIKAAQLTRLALNVPFAILMAQEGRTASEIVANHVLNVEREQLQDEIVSAAKKFGAPVDQAQINEMLESLKLSPRSSPESRQAFAQEMKQELPYNAGALLNFMRRHKIQLPLLQEYYDALH